MEGVGSRMGRASSRYGPTTTTFTGPVRKWKKQWVPLSSSPNTNNNVTKNTSTTSDAATSPLRLRRWTPVTPTKPADPNNISAEPEEPARRKFRYAPIVDLEEQKRQTQKVDKISKPSKARPLIAESDDAIGAHTENVQAAYKDPQNSSGGLLNLELGLSIRDEESESETELEVLKIEKASSAGFWS